VFEGEDFMVSEAIAEAETVLMGVVDSWGDKLVK